MTSPHIWVPKSRIIEPKKELIVKSKIRGFFQLFKSKADAYGNLIPGSRRAVTPVFENIVVDSGLNMMGTTVTWFRGCHVGVGNATPSPADVALQSRVAGQGTKHDMSLAPVDDESGVYIRRIATWRFPQGTIDNENISEVGITGGTSNANAAGDTNFILWCRSLVVDGSGNPTTVTVLQDEILDVVYECRLYIPEGTGEDEHVVGGVPTSLEIRASLANSTTNNDRWWDGTNTTSTLYIGSSTQFIPAQTGSSFGRVAGFFTGANSGIGDTINDAPTGSRVSSTGASTDAYVGSSYQQTGQYVAGLDDANDASGVGALCVRTQMSNFQVGFNPRIMKTSDDILSVDVTYSWGRHE